MLKYKFDLQTFAEGGESGAAGEGNGVAPGVADTGDDIQIPSFIPEKKHDLYRKTVLKNRSASKAESSKDTQPQEPTAEAPTATKEEPSKKQTFSQLMESDEYKEEREAYMHDAFKRRFSKYDGMEKENAAAKEILSNMAEKFGVDPASKTFMADLQKAMSNDASSKRVKEYMDQHDVDESEAKRVVEMENTLAEKARAEKAEALAKQELEKREEKERRLATLKASAEKTKAKYPDFDLESAIKDERFLRMLAATGGDTTAAYVATHHEELMTSTARKAAETASVQIANAVASNQKRAAEGAMGNASSSVAEINLKNLSKEERRKLFSEMFKRG